MDRLPFMDIMSNFPRVEITDKALQVLKIETALRGMNQKQTLEALILRGASPRALALVEEKAELEKVPQKTLMETPLVEDITEKAKIPQLTTEGWAALSFILEELQAGREPTVNEVAAKVGLTTIGLGKELSKFGILAKKTHRETKEVRIYTKPMRPRIEEIIRLV